MDRRDVIKGAGLAAMAGAVASPALAQAQPDIRWRMASAGGDGWTLKQTTRHSERPVHGE